jgi:hypothetical protein
MTHTSPAADHWPDTTSQAKPPPYHPYAAACWLLGRHPDLANIVTSIPDVVTNDGPGPTAVTADGTVINVTGPTIYLSRLAGIIRAYDGHKANLEGEPITIAHLDALDSLSGNGLGRLRLLATLAHSPRTPFNLGDLSGFDANGQRLVEDWCTILREG